jgi:uncharacterized damage-inducible protein DinB
MRIVELLLPEYDAEIAITRRVLERVPDERGEWKPHPKAFPMAHLAQLVARMPSWCVYLMKQSELDIAPPPSERKFPGYSIEKTATLLKEFEKGAADGRAAIAAGTDAQFEETWTLKAAGRAVQSGTRYQMLRSTVLNHLVHHRAQLGVYLKLVDAKVPMMYGPTADERI